MVAIFESGFFEV